MLHSLHEPEGTANKNDVFPTAIIEDKLRQHVYRPGGFLLADTRRPGVEGGGLESKGHQVVVQENSSLISLRTTGQFAAATQEIDVVKPFIKVAE